MLTRDQRIQLADVFLKWNPRGAFTLYEAAAEEGFSTDQVDEWRAHINQRFKEAVESVRDKGE